VRNASGDSIPLSALVTTRLDDEPRSLNQFNGLNTATIPLLIASEPRAVSRYHIGLVVVTGMSIGTVFTLFVLPVVYTYVAERRVGVVTQAQETMLVPRLANSGHGVRKPDVAG
jgi:multidrug efflux pump subunit AcrB